MPKLACFAPKTMILMAFALSASTLMATDFSLMPNAIQLAGEIIVTQQSGNSTASQAAELLDRARAQRRDEVPGATTIILIPESDESGELESGQSSVPNGAKANRLKAKKYQKNGTTSTDSGIILIEPAEDSSSSGRAQSSRARANSYTKGDLKSVLTRKVGADGIPLVVCKGVNNQAGRIGDDTESGSVFAIIENGRPIKVRCE